MDVTQSVERFIAAKRADLAHDDTHALRVAGTLPFITIARQSGAGGRALAEAILARLDAEASGDSLLDGWRVFDRDMCELLLQNENLREPLNELLHEEYHSQVHEFVRGFFGRHAIQGAAFPQLTQLLHTVASVGKVIIVGYGGFQATRDLAGGIDIRLVASVESRAKRMAPMLDGNEQETARIIQRRDTEQRRLLKTHYRVDSNDPELYDMVFNTDRVSIDQVADILVHYMLEHIEELKQAA